VSENALHPCTGVCHVSTVNLLCNERDLPTHTKYNTEWTSLGHIAHTQLKYLTFAGAENRSNGDMRGDELS
jgi:hypothetical protein